MDRDSLRKVVPLLRKLSSVNKVICDCNRFILGSGAKITINGETCCGIPVTSVLPLVIARQRELIKQLADLDFAATDSYIGDIDDEIAPKRGE
jgi:hypothetical protein